MATTKRRASKKAKLEPAKRASKADGPTLRVSVQRDALLAGERLQVYEARVQGCGGREGSISLGRFLATSEPAAKKKALRLARRIC